MFSRILVPLDGTAESNVALPLARTVARQTGARITLLRVLPYPYLLADRAAFDATAEALRRVADELGSGGVRVESVVRGGDDIVDEILEQSREQAADLIVMRTHGRAGLGRAVLGSVTQRVLAESGVPLLLLRPGGRRINHLGSLLVPVDGSPGGALALGTAVGLVKATGAAMKLLEVAVLIPTEVYADSMYGGVSYYDPAWDEETLASARTYVGALVERLLTAGVMADGEARQGRDVAGTIVAVADEAAVDLIVMSTQALTGPARALLGSVADAVVRTAHCPVLLIHRAGRGEQEQSAAEAAPVIGAAAAAAPTH